MSYMKLIKEIHLKTRTVKLLLIDSSLIDSGLHELFEEFSNSEGQFSKLGIALAFIFYYYIVRRALTLCFSCRGVAHNLI